MDLKTGICSLCPNANGVVTQLQAKNIINFLGDIVQEVIAVQKFNKLKSVLELCPKCLQKIWEIREYKEKTFSFLENTHKCSLCRDIKHLILIPKWPHFSTILDNAKIELKENCTLCLKCLKYLESLYEIKKNFVEKFITTDNGYELPHSKVKKRTFKKNKETNVLKHLKPISSSNFNIDQYIFDDKLVNQVLFVKLHPLKLEDNAKKPNESLNWQSIFKIKLKSKNKRKGQVKSRKPPNVKGNKSKMLASMKPLIVKIPKIDITGLKIDCRGVENTYRTPTKASLKMILEEVDCSSSKKIKHVSFSEHFEIIEDVDSSQNNSSPCEPVLENGLEGEKNQDLQLDNNLPNGSSKNDVMEKEYIDSDDEFIAAKNIVEDIIKNNDSIFESLKKSVIPEIKEPEAKESEAKEPEAKEPEAKEPEVKEPEVKEPEVKEPEVKELEVKESELKVPEDNVPEVKESEIKEFEVNLPEDNLSEVSTHKEHVKTAIQTDELTEIKEFIKETATSSETNENTNPDTQNSVSNSLVDSETFLLSEPSSSSSDMYITLDEYKSIRNISPEIEDLQKEENGNPSNNKDQGVIENESMDTSVNVQETITELIEEDKTELCVSEKYPCDEPN
ncbi:hypothetical protein ABEB36_005441 [Hypothenemus hampei]|uniref:Uncharacterized protein n=1 Tax=Hypothenemus hampei TaxID=57062 RepID=A0ABD1EY90_HYPHA